MCKSLEIEILPNWKKIRKTTLIQKEPRKQIINNNYSQKTCPATIWKILSQQIDGDIYYLLVYNGTFVEELKQWHGGTRGTGDLLYMDQKKVD